MYIGMYPKRHTHDPVGDKNRDTTDENIPKQNCKCSGKGCRNAPTTHLKINYINKVGYFCDSCTRDLLHEELAIKIGDT